MRPLNQAPPLDWSAWRPVVPATCLAPAVLAETLDGGQSFRWHRDASVGGVPSPRDFSEVWTGTWSDCLAQLRLGARASGPPHNLLLEWRAPQGIAARVAAALPRYLALDRDWTALAAALPWRSDAHLATAIAALPGLRLLRQPFGETLLGFLCSATKQIVQIKQMCALLAGRHGAPVLTDCRSGFTPRQTDTAGASRANPAPTAAAPASAVGRARTPSRPTKPWRSWIRADPAAKGLAAPPFYRLPTWSELAAVPETDLRRCQLGFRARFIHETAVFLAQRPGWLDETERLPYAAAKARLLELPGVGEKIADCVLLFGAGQLEAFPVDVWMLKVLERRYGLRGWRPAQLAQFGRAHFGPLAGLAQQYLFAWERRQARASGGQIAERTAVARA